ncbi:MAG: translation initiation factor IF-1 [Candidatus Gracilibacteria bacterium]|nr:translation initiation factor IF-1 [Candidatus Gracilibacteria bacterium]
MSNKQDKIEVEGTLVRALPGLVFDIQLPEDFGGEIIQGYLSGNMRKNFIKLIEGDKVLVELSPYDLTKGRIVFRKK